MSKKPGQRIFKRDALERLKRNLQDRSSLNDYFESSIAVDATDTWQSTIFVRGATPTLAVDSTDPPGSDAINAIAMHQHYIEMDETQASDPRLWAYLSHVEHRNYTLARWGMDAALRTSQDANRDAKVIEHVREHWFVSGNDRDLRRHALARLWWAAHLTRAPWELDADYFADTQNEDPYVFTRVLLSTQDIFQQTLERRMGRSNRILISILDYLRRHQEFASSRVRVRRLLKELNLAYGVKEIIALSRQALSTLIDQTCARINVNES